MAKWWARAKTCSASLASAACKFTLWLWGLLARCAIALHLASAAAVVAGQAVVSHPLGESLAHQLPGAARRLLGRGGKLQRALVLPWVLLVSAAALLWAACAIFSAGRHVCRHSKRCLGAIVCCGGCGGCRRRAKAVHTEEVEEKDNGPPKAISSHDSSNVQHLRRRTYPKCI
jgi:hypothetical protein